MTGSVSGAAHSAFPGTQGYAQEAPALFERYEARSFEAVHAALLLLLPAGGRALDIGAGTGRDAAALARRGFAVTAVEPTAEMREGAARLHDDAAIAWVDDGLPELARVVALGIRYDLVMATAVWMHLDAAERARAMAVVAPLVADDGLLSMTLRRGPVPAGRRMFDVAEEEVVASAASHGLACILDQPEASSLGTDKAVGWQRLAFRRERRRHPREWSGD